MKPSLYLQGEYYNCPHQIFLKFSGLQNSGMEKYSSPKLPAEMDDLRDF